MNKKILYKDKFSKFYFYNYIVGSGKGEHKLTSYIYKYGLFSPISLLSGISYLDKNHLPLFKYKFAASLVGKYVYVVVKQLKLYSIFLINIKQLMNNDIYKKNSVFEKDIYHYYSKKFLFVKYKYNLYLWYKWWFRKKHKKQRRRLWKFFHRVPNSFWGNLLKKRIKYFIFRLFKNMKKKSWKRKMFLKTFNQITKSIYYFILRLKRKKMIIKKESILLHAPSKNVSDQIMYRRNKIKNLMYYPKIKNIRYKNIKKHFISKFNNNNNDYFMNNELLYSTSLTINQVEKIMIFLKNYYYYFYLKNLNEKNNLLKYHNYEFINNKIFFKVKNKTNKEKKNNKFNNNILMIYYYLLSLLYKKKINNNNLPFLLRTGVLTKKFEYSNFFHTSLSLIFECWLDKYLLKNILSFVSNVNILLTLQNTKCINTFNSIILNNQFIKFIYFINKINKFNKNLKNIYKKTLIKNSIISIFLYKKNDYLLKKTKKKIGFNIKNTKKWKKWLFSPYIKKYFNIENIYREKPKFKNRKKYNKYKNYIKIKRRMYLRKYNLIKQQIRLRKRKCVLFHKHKKDFTFLNKYKYNKYKKLKKIKYDIFPLKLYKRKYKKQLKWKKNKKKKKNNNFKFFKNKWKNINKFNEKKKKLNNNQLIIIKYLNKKENINKKKLIIYLKKKKKFKYNKFKKNKIKLIKNKININRNQIINTKIFYKKKFKNLIKIKNIIKNHIIKKSNIKIIYSLKNYKLKNNKLINKDWYINKKLINKYKKKWKIILLNKLKVKRKKLELFNKKKILINKKKLLINKNKILINKYKKKYYNKIYNLSNIYKQFLLYYIMKIRKKKYNIERLELFRKYRKYKRFVLNNKLLYQTNILNLIKKNILIITVFYKNAYPIKLIPYTEILMYNYTNIFFSPWIEYWKENNLIEYNYKNYKIKIIK